MSRDHRPPIRNPFLPSTPEEPEAPPDAWRRLCLRGYDKPGVNAFIRLYDGTSVDAELLVDVNRQ